MKTIEIYVEENDKTYKLVVGQNRIENDKILRESSQMDLWFHLEKQSGPHIILRMDKEERIPKRYLNYIGGLFREYKNSLGSRYAVIYTQMKNVRLTDEPGLVIPVNSKIKKITF
jgi:predicted ribosome quality control (RQC) complex YloA/Tae2 family protein